MRIALKISPFLFLSFSVFLSSWASSGEENWNRTVYACTSQGCVPLETSKENDTNLKNSLPANQVNAPADFFSSQRIIYFPNRLEYSSLSSTQTSQKPSSSEKDKKRIKVTFSGKCQNYPDPKKARTTTPQRPLVTTTTSQRAAPQFLKQTANQQRKKATEEFLQKEREEQEKFQKLSCLPTLLPNFQPNHFPASNSLKASTTPPHNSVEMFLKQMTQTLNWIDDPLPPLSEEDKKIILKS